MIMLDSMGERYVHDPVVFGVLVEGITMRTFKMDLEYDRIYRPINVRTCYLPRGKNDLSVLKGTLRGLFQLKASAFFNLVVRSLKAFRSGWSKDEQTLTRKKYMRPTALLPTSSLICELLHDLFPN
ncbi:hypothetical protein BDC45DRAFT_533716 [Circinella umbellata]|nr:hypothetical protein BDC45DRAFT_533716 [Circinella umbellata]